MSLLGDTLIRRRLQSVERRLGDTLDTLMNHAEQISTIRLQFASIRGSLAVRARKDEATPAERKLLREILGGDLVAVKEVGDDAK